MVFDSGETGRIEGSIGIGAWCREIPLAHVLRFAALGRTLKLERGSVSLTFAGDRGGVVVCAVGPGIFDGAAIYWGTAGALSRATNDFLNQADVFEVRV